jgi:hypothetical protein
MNPTHSVSSPWRHPVKSLAGEELDAVRVDQAAPVFVRCVCRPSEDVEGIDLESTS